MNEFIKGLIELTEEKKLTGLKVTEVGYSLQLTVHVHPDGRIDLTGDGTATAYAGRQLYNALRNFHFGTKEQPANVAGAAGLSSAK